MNPKTLRNILWGTAAAVLFSGYATQETMNTKYLQEPENHVGQISKADDPQSYNSVLSRLQKDVFDIIKAHPDLATSAPDCVYVTGGLVDLLKGNYRARGVEATSTFVEAEVDHSIMRMPHAFVIVEATDKPIIVDGTYRQFFWCQGADMPDIYVGDLNGLKDIFENHSGLLTIEIRSGIFRVKGGNRRFPVKNDVGSFVEDLYREALKD